MNMYTGNKFSTRNQYTIIEVDIYTVNMSLTVSSQLCTLNSGYDKLTGFFVTESPNPTTRLTEVKLAASSFPRALCSFSYA